VYPDEVIYIEDRPMFVSIAKMVGITGIRHKDYKTTAEKLKSFGLSL